MQWIDQAAQLQVLQSLHELPALAMDTEFMREKTYFPELALLQLGGPEHILLLDAPALGAAGEVVSLLESPVLKVMHSAGEDLQALHHAYGALPRPLFDTQVAAALCGLDPTLSYQKLVAQLCTVTLEKGETRSDWLRRPLSDAQLQYAADDVRYLLEPARILSERLASLDRRAWLDEDCETALAAAVDSDDPHPHLAMRPAQGLPAAAQARLRRLLRWREQVARASNRPRNWVLDAGLALDLAQAAPFDRVRFEQLLDRNPKSPRRRRDELFDLTCREPELEELDIPLAQLPGPAEREQLRAMQGAVSNLARQLGMHESVLASRRHLETLLREGRWSRHLSGWRRPQLAPVLLPLLPAPMRARAES
jgi:ribonuclease D